MHITEIEKNLEKLVENFSKNEFIFDLLLAYGVPKATITLLKKGRHNLSKKDGEIILKKKLLFQEVEGRDLHQIIDNLQNEASTMSHSPRFIIVTDYTTLLAVDTKNKDQLDIEIKNITKYYDFFLPWAGIEKHNHSNENPADRKAAETMAKLYDGILEENSIENEERTHDLNVFLSRLLFCFFAEDTNIFEEKIFTNYIASHTQADGSDLDTYLDTLFDVLNTKDSSKYPSYLQKLPYVNGGLFAKKHWIPKFSARSRKIIIECGKLDWSKINPDIFGSMIQAVVHSGERGSLGMHYTSVPNIMKVIGPLFLNNLKDEFYQNRANKKKLEEILSRIARIKFFDPACGSGNFLIITYKELRRLEMEIIKELGIFAFSGINLSQFYGIEIDDFAHEIAKLSLYLAEHQMNIEFKEEFKKVSPTLPLKTGGNIVCKNATLVQWENICPKNENDEIYILGNPPYLGARNQSKMQKDELRIIFQDREEYKDTDYIACWFLKGADYIKQMNAKLSFVSTNSISQGEQVAFIWPYILERNLEIFFAYQSFKWENNAKGNAGVTCIIVGIENINKAKKFIYSGNNSFEVQNITPYLTSGRTIIVKAAKKPISQLPLMVMGNMARDGGNLILSAVEKGELLKKFPESTLFLRKFYGAQEFLNGTERWCLWISDEMADEARKIDPIQERIKNVYNFRITSEAKTTISYASIPHKFAQRSHKSGSVIIVPRVSSERRHYIPFGFLDENSIISDSAQAIYNAEPWIFGIISSCMHMVWVRSVCGSLETRIRYSSALGYNTFPIPPLTAKQKEEITRHVYTILEERENHSEKNIAQLYDPDKMPDGLKEAHRQLDLAVERCYRSKPFNSDEERLEYLFKLYEQMIAEAKARKL